MNWFTPETLQQPWFHALAAFVSMNTLIYATISLISVLPKINPTEWFTSRNTRSQTRSIYPEDWK